MEPPAKQDSDGREDDPFPDLTERERRFLRYAADHLKSKAIARIEGVTPRTVDRLMGRAANKLGTNDRYVAARRFIAVEKGGGSSPLQSSPLDDKTIPRLSMPVPTRRMPVNLLKVRDVLIWVAILMVTTQIGLTVAAMAILAFMLLFGARLT